MKALYISARDMHYNSNRVARRPIRDVMSNPVVSVAADLPMAEALLILVRSGRRHLVVIDEFGRCIGVLADRAIAAAWAADPAVLSVRSAGSVLDAEPAIVSEHAMVVDAARAMRDAGVDAVAVIDELGVAIGIVTCTDMIALLAR